MVSIKKIIILTLVFAITLSSMAFAQEDDEAQFIEKIQDINITIQYDSFLYPAKLFFERLRLINSFTQEGKSNVSGIFAKRRLAESNYMIEIGQLDEASKLMIDSLEHMTLATEYVADAILNKDNERTRLVLTNVSSVQTSALLFFTEIKENYPDTFEIDEMMLEVKEDIIDIMVVWTYLSYKENVLENAEIRQGARAAIDAVELKDGTINIDAIASATISTLDEAGISLSTEEVEAIASATYDVMVEEGIGSEDLIDAISSATEELLQENPTAEPGVDTTTSATTTVDDSTTNSDGAVDTTSSATPSGSGEDSSDSEHYYDDDEYEDHDDEDDDDDDEDDDDEDDDDEDDDDDD